MLFFQNNKKQVYLSCKEAIDSFSDTVYKVALSNMKNSADAQDIFQEVFIKYANYNKGFVSIEHAKAWFIRVTINCCHDMHKDKNRKETTSLEEEIPFEHQQEHEITYYVKQLDNKYREVIHLFYYEEYSIKEVANILEIPEATVKTRLSRAKEKLKMKWEERQYVR